MAHFPERSPGWGCTELGGMWDVSGPGRGVRSFPSGNGVAWDLCFWARLTFLAENLPLLPLQSPLAHLSHGALGGPCFLHLFLAVCAQQKSELVKLC